MSIDTNNAEKSLTECNEPSHSFSLLSPHYQQEQHHSNKCKYANDACAHDSHRFHHKHAVYRCDKHRYDADDNTPPYRDGKLVELLCSVVHI